MIYTAICGGFDSPRTDVHCFTESGIFASPRMGAKLYKILPHLFFRDDITVWVDGNIIPVVGETEIVSQFLPGDANIGVFVHPYRTTIRQELEECIRLKFMTSDQAVTLSSFLGSNVDTLPLCECGVLVRRNTSDVNSFNALWWSLICRFSSRDQTTFPYAIASSQGIRLHVVDSNVRISDLFSFPLHGQTEPRKE